VLKHLSREKHLAEKVQLIYIDPPFATGQAFRGGEGRTSTVSPSENDELAYIDNLGGFEYLEFLRRRLILLRELLAEDGSIYLHIDSKMGHYVKVVMDEVFGAQNFVNDISRVKCNPKNFSRKGYGNIKDVILFYSKSARFVWHEPKERMSQEDIVRLFPRVDAEGRRYTTTPLHAPGETQNGATGRTWKGLEPPPGRHWRVPPDELSRLDKGGLIEWSRTGNPRKKIYANDVAARGKKLQDVWLSMKDPQYPTYPTEKNATMLARIVEASSDIGGLVLDCFAGSGTTLLAAESLRRQWIGIDESELAVDIAAAKLRESGSTSFTVFCSEQNVERKSGRLIRAQNE
jgi:adenine-specific DNA-methyltransferase